MFKNTSITAFAVAVSVASAGVQLTSWQVGGAGGSVALGSASDAMRLDLVLGAPIGGVLELDDSTTARLGFWSPGAAMVSTAIQPPSGVRADAIRAAYDGSHLHVDLQVGGTSEASIRLMGADGRAVEPAWSGTLASGSTRHTIDLNRHRGRVLFLLVEVGGMRRSYQIHAVSR